MLQNGNGCFNLQGNILFSQEVASYFDKEKLGCTFTKKSSVTLSWTNYENYENKGKGRLQKYSGCILGRHLKYT